MKLITISGIDKSGKTTLAWELLRATNFKHYVVDRDPSNYNVLNVIQNRIENRAQLVEYDKFAQKFKEVVDLSILLIVDVDVLKQRFKEHNEPDLVGGYDFSTHQDMIYHGFMDVEYKNKLVIDTSKSNIEESIDLILNKIGETRCQ